MFVNQIISRLSTNAGRLLNTSQLNSLKSVVRGMGGDGGQSRFVIRVSRYHRTRFLRHLVFYTSLTGIPAAFCIFYSNTRIGVAQLVDTPEGYEPYYYEYYGHPITRFLAKHFGSHPQREYEKELSRMAKKRETVLQRMCQQRAKLLNNRLGEVTVWGDQLITQKYVQGHNFNERMQLIQSPNSLYNAKNTLEHNYDKL